MKEKAIIDIITSCKKAISKIKKYNQEQATSSEPEGIKIRCFIEAVSKLGGIFNFL